jgi:two-component system sensor histidine kinase DegS
MTNTRTKLAARYLTALRSHLGRKRSVARECAQTLGRAALAGGLATRDLAFMHEQAVVALTQADDFVIAGSSTIKQAGYFFTQALIPLEAAQKATRATNRLLEQRNETLRLHTAALARANHRLESEIMRRQAGERTIRQAKEQYQQLFAESQIMQRKLREVTRQIISAQEEERKEISRELHDEVVQTLVGINVELSALSKGASAGLHVMKAKIARTQRLVENSVSSVHRFARELRPVVLDHLGLIPALHAYSKNLAAQKKLKIRLTAFQGVEALGNARRTVLYRVAQEALTNVARHAQATEISVVISEIPGAIRMEIRDNGKSFQVEKTLRAKSNKRLGLVGMKERVEMVHGKLTIESSPNKGTIVRAEIPFQSANRNT